MSKSNFGEDLKVEIAARTEELLADEKLSFTQKARALGNISAYSLSFDPGYVESSVRGAAVEGKTVAALVQCDVVPFFSAVFVGKVSGEEPLTLSHGGTVGLAAKSGFMLRAWMNNDGHHGFRWAPTSLYGDELVPVTSERLSVSKNYLVPAHFTASQMTPEADEVLARMDGLDFKICYEGVNLPELGEKGDIADRYDRLGLVGLLGEELYTEVISEVSKAPVK